MRVQLGEAGLQCTIALGQLFTVEVEVRQCLLEGKQVFGAPVTMQAAGDLILTGANSPVLHGGKRVWITFARDDCANDSLPGFADHVGNDVRQLDVHLGESLLHVLHTAGLASESPFENSRMGDSA